jgi:glycyl-tRNA synthetase
VVIQGNEDVIRARFADGAFFIAEDKKRALADYLPILKTLMFQADLGSMWDKTDRIVRLVEKLIPDVGLSSDQGEIARRAAALCKADLVTNMVVEMTALQGVMGRYYALDSGEPEAVAQAIEEHYVPRHAGGRAPEGMPGLIVGMADRLDTLIGLFAAGLAPTGAKDPFAQRRAALGLVGNLIAWDLGFDLRSALHAAAGNLPIQTGPETEAACLGFIVERLRNLLLDAGHRFDIVEAVVAAQGYNPARAGRGVVELAEWIGRDDWSTILPAYARCVRITRDLGTIYSVDPVSFSNPAEQALLAALEKAEAVERDPGSINDFLDAFIPLIPEINSFFDDVLVMAEEPAVRQNRLGLLQRIAALADGAVDMSRLEGF